MTEPTNDDPSREKLQYRIENLEAQVAADRKVIESLQAEGLVDRSMIANLEIALVGARRIGAAMGILMARQQLTDDQAFDMLREVSERKRVRVRDVADLILRTGALPD